MRVKEIPLSERPRERLKKVGPENLSTSDLLSILLASGTKDKNVTELSFELLAKIENLSKLEDISFEELCETKGIGQAKAATILAALELGKRIFLSTDLNRVKLTCAKDVFSYSKYLFHGKKQELFYCLYLNSNHILISTKLLFVGTLNRSSVHPREIFKEAYKVSANSIICIHNHPSGILVPSKKDIEFTKDLIQIGIFQGIPILDHLIVSEHNYFSFGENNDKEKLKIEKEIGILKRERKDA